jgi:very-short-patch-repair endonuclease
MLRDLAPKAKVAFAKHLRKSQTPGEKVLWLKLKKKQFHGLKFRRQAPLGSYIVDFLCIEKNLIIEVDGDSHFQPGAAERDAIREAYLVSLKFRVLRFGNRQVVESCDWVLEEIRSALGLSVQ